ncbi:putative pentatricopeptide repeat-containing protein At1g68930 [Cryptomeria japonica]|uniref:putative pentatricopeptide repeat-containing protein At1g68930 n=1 Tax=Cryptomeria japonica TaxID=3369 RepID=UPI0025AC0565|nr:putative pentatricopeptide repeat-containing protein At1g68930 [Cryptomeria japonica]
MALQLPFIKHTTNSRATYLYNGINQSLLARRGMSYAIEKELIGVDTKAICKNRGFDEILSLMEKGIIPTDSNSYGYLLQLCIHKKLLTDGGRLHAHMINTGFQSSIFVHNRLIEMYAKCGKLENARQMFDEMPERNVFSWNTMMGGYSTCGFVEDARDLFDKMTERDVVSWTTVISGYAQNGNGDEALALFGEALRIGCKPNQSTFVSVLSACAGLQMIKFGKQVHNLIIKTRYEMHAIVGNALTDMYGKCGIIKDARNVFDKMPNREEVSWSSMIAGYVQNGDGDKAFDLFKLMLKLGVKPNDFTFASSLGACGSMAGIEEGMQVHTHIIRSGYQSNIFVGNALVDMYVKCGSMDYGCLVFEKMPEPDAISWTSLIVGYSQSGNSQQAVKLFCRMRQMGIKPDSVTFSSILSSCAGLATGEQGRQVHAIIIKCLLMPNVAVGSALVNMYAKCGGIQDAQQVFDRMTEQNVPSWNAIIGGYGQNGQGMAAIRLFEQMLDEGIKPNDASFIAIISACCHAGLVDEGRHYFNSMINDHFISPRLDHFACMVDLLGRAGYLEEAADIINNMAIEPDASIWGALLNACRIYPNLELAKQAAGRLFELEPQNAGPYVLYSNILAAAGRWNDAATVRRMMKDKRVRKTPGCSWIEVNNQVHTFVVTNVSNPQTEDIDAMLQKISKKMEAEGYVPEYDFLLDDIQEH